MITPPSSQARVSRTEGPRQRERFRLAGGGQLERVLGTRLRARCRGPGGSQATRPPRSGEVGGDDGNGDAVAARLMRAL